jgi:hypothetical protein
MSRSHGKVLGKADIKDYRRVVASLQGRYRGIRFRNKPGRRIVNWRRHKGLSPEDVLLATFPRSGTTWVRFLLFEVIAGEPAEFQSTRDAIPYIGRHEPARRWLHGKGRLIMTHECYCPGDTRVVYIVRDPRSVVVSQFFWLRRRGLIGDDFDAFLRKWLRGKAVPWGRWDAHVNFWLSSVPAMRGRFHLVKYEHLRRDSLSTMSSLLAFLEVEANNETLLSALASNTIERMREKEERAPRLQHARRPDIPFVRSGSMAGWKKTLNAHQEGLILESFGETLHRLGYVAE